MYSGTSSVALAASLVALASAQLDKPVIEPNFPNGGLDSLGQGLLDNLTPTQSTFEDWEAGLIAQDCKTIAEGSGFSAADITTFNILYTDCPDPWVFCRHKDADLSEIDMIDIFGRLPVGMRSFNRHIIALPGTASAGSNGDNVQMNGPVGITVFVHENAHSLDSQALDPSPFSNGQTWLDAYNADSAVTDSYGQTSQQENFAQMTVVALYDKVVPGGVGTIQPNAQAISNQYTTAQNSLGDVITPGGTCTNRLVNSPAVPISNSAKINTASAPTVALSENVTEIKAIPMSPVMKLTHFDSAGKATGSSTVKLNV